MASQTGKEAAFEVGGSWLPKVRSVDFTWRRTMVDSTDNDSLTTPGGDAAKKAKAYLPGDEDGDCVVTWHYDGGDTVTGTLLAAMAAGTVTTFDYWPQGAQTAGLPYLEFQGILMELSLPSNPDLPMEATMRIQITGGVYPRTV